MPALVKAVLERGCTPSSAIGYEKGDAAGRGAPNNRNGYTPKTVPSEVGPVGLAVARDRDCTFEPRLVPKGSRPLAGGLDDMIISLYAGGLTVRDIGFHLYAPSGCSSATTPSKITDGVLEEVKAWQTPLDLIYRDPLHRRAGGEVRDGAHVRGPSIARGLYQLAQDN